MFGRARDGKRLAEFGKGTRTRGPNPYAFGTIPEVETPSHHDMKSLVYFIAIALSGTLLSAQSVPPLVTLASTYIGGGGKNYSTDTAFAVATGTDGAVYVVGQTSSEVFPHTAVIGGADGGYGTFVAKLGPDGKSLVYSTFLSGLGARALAVDSSGSVYITGETGGVLPGNSSAQPELGGNFDAFVLKLNPDGGSVAYATYLGGSDLELGRGIAVDGEGAAYVVGWTSSTNFPATAGAAQTQIAGSFDAFVAKLNPAGTQFTFATYLGGASFESGAALALDAERRPIVVGRSSSTHFTSSTNPTRLGSDKRSFDAYVARLKADGSAVDYLTFIGGENADTAARVAIAADGAPVILGQTESEELPTTLGALQRTYRGSRDLFVARLAPAGDALVYCTYLGTPGSETVADAQYVGGYWVDGRLEEGTMLRTESGGLALDREGNAYIAGITSAEIWPNAASANNGNVDGFLAKLGAAGDRLLAFNFLGGRGDDTAQGLAYDGQGGAWVVGEASRPYFPPYFPTTSGAAQEEFGGGLTDAFATRLGPAVVPPFNDDFSNRLTLKGARFTVRSTREGATLQPGEPGPSGDGFGGSVWWSWTAPADGKLILDATDSGFEALISVYVGDTLESLVPVPSVEWPATDTDTETRADRVLLRVNAGVRYNLLVSGRGSNPDVVLHFTFSQPSNDFFAARTLLNGFPISVRGSNRNATMGSPREVSNAGVPGGQSVWWEWVSPTNGVVAISTAGSDFNTTLGVYTGTSLDDLKEVKGNDNYSNQEGADQTSQLTFPATEGTRYFISVDGYYSESGSIRLSLFPGDPPPNDTFALRAELKGFFAKAIASNLNATVEAEAGEPLLAFTNSVGNVDASSAGYSVWWTWTAPTNGQVKIFTTDIQFDTRIGVYTGSALGALQFVAGNDNRGGVPVDYSSFVKFPVTAGTTYQIEVDGNLYGGHSGVFTLNLLLERPPILLGATVEKHADGGIQFQVQGLPGVTYRIEHSDNMKEWIPGPTVTPENEFFTVKETPETAQPHLFYRVAEVEVGASPEL